MVLASIFFLGRASKWKFHLSLIQPSLLNECVVFEPRVIAFYVCRFFFFAKQPDISHRKNTTRVKDILVLDQVRLLSSANRLLVT